MTNFDNFQVGQSVIFHADCFQWLKLAEENSIHAVVTDPPYGLKEYEDDQLEKKDSGSGGVWRIPPSFDGHKRSPVPRFTALTTAERQKMVGHFKEWAKLLGRVLRPGGHVFVASNAFLSNSMFAGIAEGGLEFRGEVIRLVRTLRGGDRPKNAEEIYPNVCSLPRGCYEPWGLFRKPMPSKMTVADCLKEWQTGGLHRNSDGGPFLDVIQSERTPAKERRIAAHPSLKPQSFLRNIIRASLPLDEGVVLDCFCGAGSTMAAAEALNVRSIGVEKYGGYFQMSKKAVPLLKECN